VGGAAGHAAAPRKADPPHHHGRERGQVSETTSAKGSSESTAAATATIAAKADTETDSKPSLGLPYLGLLLAGIAASAILTRGVWLGPLLGFIRGKL
jgi:hypothetical protein